MNNKTNIFGEPIESETNNIFSQQQEPITNEFSFNEESTFTPEPEPAVEQTFTPEPEVETTPEVETNSFFEQPVVEEQPSQPQIEIPQEYYDNLAKEKEKKELEEAQAKEEEKKFQEQNSGTGALIGMIIVNCALILGIIYSYLNVKSIIFLALPGYIVLLTIFNALAKKEKSDFPQSVLVGGIFAAIITFVLSMTNQEKTDLYMYYALASGITGIVGYIISSFITNTIAKFKEMKAMQTIGTFLVLAIMVGAPVYAYMNYQEEIHKYIFFEQIEVKAETQEEFIVKTLKNRYNEVFTCDTKVKNLIDQNKERMTVRDCTSASGIIASVQSIVYEPSKVQYTIIDNYLDKKYFDSIKTALQDDIKNATMSNSVTVHLYTNLNCNFIGDCVETQDYLTNKNNYNNRDNKYKTSTELTFANKLPETGKEFLNENNFRYIITINGNYNGYTDQALSEIAERVLSYLNNHGYKNTNGYDINIKGANALDDATTYNKLLYAVTGEASETLTFDNAKIVEVEK